MYTSTRAPRITESDGEISVLHVDDEPDLAALVSDFLEQEDDRIAVQTVTSAREGLKYLADTECDCVISDYDMPGQDGIDFLETVRKEHPDLPFILYTGKGSEEVAGEAISAGVTDYLQKERGTDQYSILANRVVNAVERYRATEHIERQNDLFRKAQDIASVGAWEYDVETGAVYNSEEVLRIHGLSPDEDMSAEKSLGYYHPDDRPLIRNAFQQAIEAGESYDLELRLIDDDGNQRWIRTRGEPQTENGDIVRVRGTIQDITEHKEREQNLEQFKQAAEHAGHAVYVTDPNGTMEYVNPAFEQITGYAAEEALGQNPRILKSGEMSEEHYEELWESVLTGEIWEEDVINWRKNGELYHAHQTIAPILDEADEIEAFVAIQTDITARKEERERLDFLESLETRLTELASDLLQIDQKSTESKINEALETIGTLVNADRSYVFQIDHGEEALSNTHEWTAEGIEPQIDALQEIPQDTLPWWMERMENHETLTIPAVSQLPPEAGAEQDILQEQNIKSVIVAPMISEGELIGFIGFDWVEQQQDAWSEDFVHILEISGEILSSAIQRESRRRELERREAYLDQSNDIISVIDTSGAVTYQSTSTERVTGFSPAEVIGDSGFEHVHPEDVEKLAGVFSSFVAQPDEEVQLELRVETKDGDWRWIEVRGVNKLNDPVIEGLLFSSRDITERKETQAALGKSEKRYRSLIESQNDLIVRVDADNRFTFVNDTYCEFFGESEEELLGEKFTSMIHEDDIEDTMNAMESLEEPPHRVTVEQRAMTEEGWRWIQWEDSAVLNENGDIEEIQAVGRDITDRKAREQKLQQYQHAYESSQSGITIADPDGKLTNVNPAFLDMWGYDDEDDVIGRSMTEVLWKHPEKAETALETFNQRGSWEGELEAVRADGSTFTARGAASHLTDDNGEPIGVMATFVDITERKEREREIQTLTDRLELAVEGANLGVWDWDMTTDEVEFNEQWAAMLGYSLDEVESHLNAWEKRVHPDDLEGVRDALDAHIAGETDYYDTEHRMQTAAGEWKWIRDTGRVVERDEDGDPIRAVGIHLDITDQKETQQFLKEERDMFVQGPAVVFKWENTEGWPVEYVSDNVAETLGYTPAQLKSGEIPYTDLIHPDDLDRVASEVDQHSDATTERFSHEPYRMVTSDGEIKWVIDNTKIVREDGEITHYLGYLVDITERKEREQELRRTNTVLRTIVESLPMGVLVEDAERDVLMANDLLGETLGIPVAGDELIGRDCATAAEELKDLFADPEGFIEDITERIERREPVQNEDLPLVDGRILERDYVPYTLPGGEANLWLYRDITERKQQKQELERTSQFLQDTQEVAHVGGWAFNLQSETLRWSDEVYRIHGLALDADVTPEDDIEFYHPDDRDTIRESFDRLTAEGEPYDLELRIVTADGDVRWVRTRGEPRYEDEEIVAVQGTFQDITERKEHEKEIQRQNSRLSEFASVVSHDLRNPLTVAQGRATMLQEQCDGESQEHLDTIETSIERMESIIEDTLTLARQGETVGEMGAIPVTGLVEQCWGTVETAGATLEIEDGFTVRGDRERLRHVFENLFRNAVEHAGDDVTVRVGPAGEDRFYVEDDGPGIPADDREAVFEAGHSSATDGTGFGLTIVKRIAEAHGWGVIITDGRDGGARFEFDTAGGIDE